LQGLTNFVYSSKTIEDSHRKQVSVDDVVSMLDILDTAGQEEYSSMQDQWFRQGQGFLVVYSVVNRKSFNEVTPLRQKIERIKDSKDIPMVLVSIKN
jgi:GTPase KRas protein